MGALPLAGAPVVWACAGLLGRSAAPPPTSGLRQPGCRAVGFRLLCFERCRMRAQIEGPVAGHALACILRFLPVLVSADPRGAKIAEAAQDVFSRGSAGAVHGAEPDHLPAEAMAREPAEHGRAPSGHRC